VASEFGEQHHAGQKKIDVRASGDGSERGGYGDGAARISLAELLEGHGYRVVQAEDGARALSALMERSFDAGLLDIRMPGFDGLTILSRAREAGITG